MLWYVSAHEVNLNFSSKILFTLERNGANTVPIRSDDTNVPYRLCNFKALEQA